MYVGRGLIPSNETPSVISRFLQNYRNGGRECSVNVDYNLREL